MPAYTEHQVFEQLRHHSVVVSSTGAKRYYNSSGVFHRTDGPAVEWADGTREWWLYGVRYAEPTYYTALKAMGIQNDH